MPRAGLLTILFGLALAARPADEHSLTAQNAFFDTLMRGIRSFVGTKSGSPDSDDPKVSKVTAAAYDAAKERLPRPVAVCTEMLNEGAYLHEWVHFHRRMGVTKFYLFDNGSTDDTKREAEQLADFGVELVDRDAIVASADYSGEDASASRDPGVADQLAFISACVRHAHEQLGKSWVWNMDVDEFLVAPNSTGQLGLADQLGEVEKAGGSQLLIARQIFGSSGRLWPCEGAVTHCYTKRMSRQQNMKACENAPIRTAEIAALEMHAMTRETERNVMHEFFGKYCANYAQTIYGKFAVLSDAVERLSETWGVQTAYGTNVTCDETSATCGLIINHYQLKSLAEFMERTTNEQSAWAPKYRGHPDWWFAVFDDLSNAVDDDSAAVQLGEWYPSSTYQEGSHGLHHPLAADSKMSLYPRKQSDLGDPQSLVYYPSSMQAQLSESTDECASSSAKPLGVLLLGMHHSGTSLLAKLLIRSGLYGGKRGELLVQKNQLKFWEHAPTVEANQELYVEQVRTLSMDETSAWTGSRFDLANTTTTQLHNFLASAARAVRSLVCPARPFVVKDPRMAMTASLWTGAYKQRAKPMCLIMWRPSHKVADALMAHNPHNCTEWCTELDEASLYELGSLHGFAALETCAAEELPTMIIGHASLLNPKALVTSVLSELASIDGDDSQLPDPTGEDAMQAAEEVEGLDEGYFHVHVDAFDDRPETTSVTPRALAVDLVLTTHTARGSGSTTQKEPRILSSALAKHLSQDVAHHDYGLRVLSAIRRCRASLSHYMDMGENMAPGNKPMWDNCTDVGAAVSKTYASGGTTHVLTTSSAERIAERVPTPEGGAESNASAQAVGETAHAYAKPIEDTGVVRRFMSENAKTLLDARAGFSVPRGDQPTVAAYTGPVWLAWTTNASEFGKMQVVVLQSIFRHNPGARVCILSNELNLETDSGDVEIITRLARAGYDISVKPLPVDEIVKHMPKYDPNKPYAYSHLTDVLRYYQVNRHGGVYLDFDMVVTNPWTDMPERFFHLQEDDQNPPPRRRRRPDGSSVTALARNLPFPISQSSSLLATTRALYVSDSPHSWTMNTAFMRFEKGSKLLELLLKKCAQYHNPDDWTSVGNWMVMDQLKRMREAHAAHQTRYEGYDLSELLDFRMLRMDEAAPVSYAHVAECSSDGPRADCQANFHHGYVFHLYGHVNTYAAIGPRSCLRMLYSEHLVFSEDAADVLSDTRERKLHPWVKRAKALPKKAKEQQQQPHARYRRR